MNEEILVYNILVLGNYLKTEKLINKVYGGTFTTHDKFLDFKPESDMYDIVYAFGKEQNNFYQCHGEINYFPNNDNITYTNLLKELIGEYPLKGRTIKDPRGLYSNIDKVELSCPFNTSTNYCFYYMYNFSYKREIPELLSDFTLIVDNADRAVNVNRLLVELFKNSKESNYTLITKYSRTYYQEAINYAEMNAISLNLKIFDSIEFNNITAY